MTELTLPGDDRPCRPPRILALNGEWLVPASERPPGWRKMRLTKPGTAVAKVEPGPLSKSAFPTVAKNKGKRVWRPRKGKP